MSCRSSQHTLHAQMITGCTEEIRNVVLHFHDELQVSLLHPVLYSARTHLLYRKHIQHALAKIMGVWNVSDSLAKKLYTHHFSVYFFGSFTVDRKPCPQPGVQGRGPPPLFALEASRACFLRQLHAHFTSCDGKVTRVTLSPSIPMTSSTRHLCTRSSFDLA